MMGLVVYEYCATDAASDLDKFESAWTQSGVGLAMANEATDRIE